ncbi:hypothetical protein [Thioalkalivibrio sp. HK1]|uniref:hypothetical protein n=1 Tax=Thioalkalivibrio sp. HK1 TaxID=1469245 RepID=UPI000472468C|nr:hypothetical protein [Thioalkalivibrio sp. HK1]
MSEGIASIMKRVDEECHTTGGCGKDGCRVDLKGMPKPPGRLIVDMDCKKLHIPTDRKRCDYLIFSDDPINRNTDVIVVIPMEMKSGRVIASDVIRQIQGGIKTAKSLIDSDILTRFVPILVHKKGLNKKERIELRKPIKICGIVESIKSMKSGACLKDNLYLTTS